MKLVFALILVQKLVSNLVIFLIPCANPRFYSHPMFGPIGLFLSLLLGTFMDNYASMDVFLFYITPTLGQITLAKP
jgi:hypothetical protein